MAQDIGDVFEAGAVVDHLGGDSMPEDMTRAARGTTSPACAKACRTIHQTALVVNG